MSKINWFELTKEEIFATLRLAPKVLGAWELMAPVYGDSGKPRYMRRDPFGRVVASGQHTFEERTYADRQLEAEGYQLIGDAGHADGLKYT